MSTTLCADGLPPIISAQEFLAIHIEPPTGPLFPCEECEKEQAEPTEIERHRQRYPDWKPGERCSRYDDEPSDWPHLLMQRVRGNWDKDFVDKVIETAGRLTPDQRDKFELKWIGKEDGEEIDRHKLITVDNLIAFNRENDPNVLIGPRRWVCKGYQNIIQGPTGVGKSSLIMQWAMASCLGHALFKIEGLEPISAMRVLIIQAENDEGDMAEPFQDIVKLGKIADSDLRTIKDNLTIIENRSASGNKFVRLFEKMVETHNPNIIFVDALLAYMGSNLMEQQNMTKFMRSDINPILAETGSALFWVHHIGKPGGSANGHERSSEEKKYAGLGSSEQQNVCKEVVNLSDKGAGMFELQFSKRGGRVGLVDNNLKSTNTINIEHCPDGIAWTLSEGLKAHANKSQLDAVKAVAAVRALIIAKTTVTKSELKSWAKTNGVCGVNAVIDYANALTQEKNKDAPYKFHTYKKGKFEVFSTEPQFKAGQVF